MTALDQFNQSIADVFNKQKPPDRVVLLQIDLSKAFDMVNHEKLLNDLNQTTLLGPIKRWFNCYLLGRQSKVQFRLQTSSARNVRTGVPQGAVTSPILFNFYLTKIPTPPSNITLIQYADDISVYATGSNIFSLSASVTQFITSVEDYLTERDSIVTPEKSTVTLFTPDTKEFKIHPKVKMQGHKVRLDQNPKLLGVTFDTMFNFSAHVKNTVTKAKSKLNILKALAVSTWGQDKGTIVITYKSIIRSTLEYAAPVWIPSVCPSNWDKLESIQNQALRIASGCLLMSSSDHIHQECKVLPLKQHSQLLCKQYLAGSFLPIHPGNKILNNPH